MAGHSKRLTAHPLLAHLDEREREALLEQARASCFGRTASGLRHLMPFVILLAAFTIAVLLPAALWALWRPATSPLVSILMFTVFPALAAYAAWKLHDYWYTKVLLAEIRNLRDPQAP